MKSGQNIKSILFVLFILSTSHLSYAEDKADLAKAAQNPVANMISLPFQDNINTGIGPDDETQNILNIQPVWPISLNDDWNVITRTIVPVVSQPDILTGEGRINGLGDTSFSAFFSPAKSDSLTWGVGPVFLLPTATDDKLGADKWGAGGSAVVLAMPGNWVVGSLVSNIWSIGGSGEMDVNLFTWQYFVNYNLPHGWYLTSAPIITANWEADSDNRWTVPIGGGVGKIFTIGSQPINGQISAYNNIESPDPGADWQFRLQLQFLFPK
ncbi:MAG: neuromedin U [Thermodesulfobacteriota bacterium]|nr:neuromedin U [Thermodesulfobacteriota bacterium]